MSLVERLESGTLKFTDLTLSGEGSFGFQDEARESQGAVREGAKSVTSKARSVLSDLHLPGGGK